MNLLVHRDFRPTLQGRIKELKVELYCDLLPEMVIKLFIHELSFGS